MDGFKQGVKTDTASSLDLEYIVKDGTALRDWLMESAIDPVRTANPPISRSNAKKTTSHRNGILIDADGVLKVRDAPERPQCRSSYGSTSSRNSVRTERTVDSGYYSVVGDPHIPPFPEWFKAIERKTKEVKEERSEKEKEEEEEKRKALTNATLKEFQEASKGPMARYERLQLWRRLEAEKDARSNQYTGDSFPDPEDVVAMDEDDSTQKASADHYPAPVRSRSQRTIRRRGGCLLPKFPTTLPDPAADESLLPMDHEPMLSSNISPREASEAIERFYSQEDPWSAENNPRGSMRDRRARRPIDLDLTGTVNYPRLPLLRKKSSESSWTDMSELSSVMTRADNALEPFRSALSRLLVSQYQTYRTHQSGAGSGSGSPSQRSSSSPIRSNASDLSGAKRGDKRKQNRDASDGNDEPLSTRRRMNNSNEDTTEKLLACPFCKNNPRRYRDCYKYVLRDISRLKQHLARRHRIPPHCSACSLQFESEADCAQHERARTCEVLPPKKWDGIDESQKRRLEKRISHKKTKEENWYIIYEILFPGTPRPRSPYVDTPLSDDLLALRDFASDEGPAIISDFTRTELPASLRPQEPEITDFLETIFQDAVSVLLERYMVSRPSQASDQLQNHNMASTGLTAVQSHSRGTSLSNSSDSGYSGDHGMQSETVSVGGQPTYIDPSHTQSPLVPTESATSLTDYSLPLHTSTATMASSNTNSATGTEITLSLFPPNLEDDVALFYPPNIFSQPLPPSHEWDDLLSQSLRAQGEGW